MVVVDNFWIPEFIDFVERRLEVREEEYL